MSHTIAAYEGPELGYALGIAYEALVIGLAWEGRRRADRALESGREPAGHGRWLGGAIVVGVLSGALAAWHGWLLGEGIFAVSRAVAPVLAAVAVHLFFQSASSARNLDRLAQIELDRETAVLDMLDAVRLAQIAPEDERDARIADVNAAVTRVHRHVPAGVTAEVTRPHLESERTIRDVVQEAAALAGEWMPDQSELERTAADRAPVRVNLPELVLPAGVQMGLAVTDGGDEHDRSAHDEPALTGRTDPAAAPERIRSEPALTGETERVQLERKYAPVTPATDWETRPSTGTLPTVTGATPAVTSSAPALSSRQISEIRVLRWEQNLSLEEVAERVGVPVSAVNRYAPSTDVPTTDTGSMIAVPAGRS
ncbi:helix-turn-helix domain-containing protein [Promicromonospora sp. NFX87]|uniref:helix-turn-helix domain-containing protein n=1 Tax=Promicromonospora sp. NFX87 TaxID=3402691 RepID=UPI003AFB5E4F